eukprot:10064705-Heterocapsa_arctica.AAC.1
MKRPACLVMKRPACRAMSWETAGALLKSAKMDDAEDAAPTPQAAPKKCVKMRDGRQYFTTHGRGGKTCKEAVPWPYLLVCLLT